MFLLPTTRIHTNPATTISRTRQFEDTLYFTTIKDGWNVVQLIAVMQL